MAKTGKTRSQARWLIGLSMGGRPGHEMAVCVDVDALRVEAHRGLVALDKRTVRHAGRHGNAVELDAGDAHAADVVDASQPNRNARTLGLQLHELRTNAELDLLPGRQW